ncbi:hypothetical protein J6590_098164, partial [Homalodisca vitripennis]
LNSQPVPEVAPGTRCNVQKQDQNEDLQRRRANSALYFVVRNSRNMFSIHALRILYIHLIDGLENVQTRFVRYVGVLLGFDYRTAPIHDLHLQLNLMPLHTRRIINDLLFLRKLINSNIDAPDLLVKLDFRTSRHLRLTHLFARRQYSTQYLFHSTFPRLQLLANSMPDDFDLFCTGEEAFKKKLLDWKAQALHLYSAIKTVVISITYASLHFEFVPPGKTVNAVFYLEALETVTPHRPLIFKLHYKNAHSHTAFVVTIYSTHNKNPVLPQPSYNLIGPCDIFLPPTEERAEMKELESVENIQAEVIMLLRGIPIEGFQGAFQAIVYAGLLQEEAML